MYKIVGKDLLGTLNVLADNSINLIGKLQVEEDQVIKIDKDFLLGVLQGYLYLYEKVLDHSIMPGPKTDGGKFYREVIH